MRKQNAFLVASLLLLLLGISAWQCGGAERVQEPTQAPSATPTPVPSSTSTVATPGTPLPTPTRKPATPTPRRYKACFGDLCLEEHHPTTGEYGVQYVTGTVVNTGRTTYSYVQVEINLYDAQGNLVGSTLDNVSNLEPGTRWKFKALIWEEDAAKYKITGITGF